MGYLDITNAEMRALTRKYRQVRVDQMTANRLAHEALQFPITLQTVQDQVEASWRERVAFRPDAPHLEWKRQQWSEGNRWCGYCHTPMIRTANQPRTCTVDHKHPRALGGRDIPENWIMACNLCNGRKGLMSEAEFRDLLASEHVPGARRLTA